MNLGDVLKRASEAYEQEAGSCDRAAMAMALEAAFGMERGPSMRIQSATVYMPGAPDDIEVGDEIASLEDVTADGVPGLRIFYTDGAIVIYRGLPMLLCGEDQ